MIGKAPGQQRRIVVAQMRSEPGQTSNRAVGCDRQRQDEEKALVRIAAENDCRDGIMASADVMLPLREPVERLEHGAVDTRLERFPLLFDLTQVEVDLEFEDRPRVRVGRTRIRDRYYLADLRIEILVPAEPGRRVDAF